MVNVGLCQAEFASSGSERTFHQLNDRSVELAADVVQIVFDIGQVAKFAGPPSVWQLSSGVGRNAAAIRVNRYLFVARLMVRGITADIAMLRVHRSQSVECESKGNSCGPISRRPVGIKPTVGIARSPSEAVIELVRRARDVVIACLQVRERICHWR